MFITQYFPVIYRGARQENRTQTDQSKSKTKSEKCVWNGGDFFPGVAQRLVPVQISYKILSHLFQIELV